MFSLGWLMARLFSPLPQPPASDGWKHLPAISDLGADDYVEMAFAELDTLLASVPGPRSDDKVKSAWQAKDDVGFTTAVGELHLAILQALAADQQQLSAYQVGRALSDLCWLPGQLTGDDGTKFVLGEFGREPMAALQTWLSQASAVLPAQSAATVSRSLQNWQDWADVNAGAVTGNWMLVVQALRTQGTVWHSLLSGTTNIDGQLSVDAWIEAGESISRTTGQLVRTILRRFWPAVAIVAVVTAGLLFLAIDKGSGTSKVWTSLVTVAAAFGVTGASLRAAAMKAADGLEADVEKTAVLDAHAWSVTWLPPLDPGPAKRRSLARRGVAAPQVKPNLGPPAPAVLPMRLESAPSVSGESGPALAPPAAREPVAAAGQVAAP